MHSARPLSDTVINPSSSATWDRTVGILGRQQVPDDGPFRWPRIDTHDCAMLCRQPLSFTQDGLASRAVCLGTVVSDTDLQPISGSRRADQNAAAGGLGNRTANEIGQHSSEHSRIYLSGKPCLHGDLEGRELPRGTPLELPQHRVQFGGNIDRSRGDRHLSESDPLRLPGPLPETRKVPPALPTGCGDDATNCRR
jgi:hypothetical protein